MKQPFDPQEWLNNDESDNKPKPANSQPNNPIPPRTDTDITSEVDTVVARIEAAFTDITASYADWVNVGFAFANEFGESGRSFFHRVSRFYTGYSLADCNKQYDQCLKANGHGITIRSFFHMAKQAGIDVRSDRWEDGEDTMYRVHTNAGSSPLSQDPSSCTDTIHRVLPPDILSPDVLPPDEINHVLPAEVDLPTFPDWIFPTLPKLFQDVVARTTSREERDIMTIGSLVCLSACLPRVFGIYDGRKVYSNLFAYITAQASAGKGMLVFCKSLVNLIHWQKRDQAHADRQRYDMEMREYNLIKGKDLNAEKPEKPAELLLYIPANSSSTGVFQLLSDNDGHGLIFETEGDTLAQAFKTDYGNYSDGFRKAFHHEHISYFRRTDREYVEIVEPCISALLSGTPRQIQALIPSAEDGLSSRFMYYRMKIKPIWKDVFAGGNENSLAAHYNGLGREFFSLYNTLKEKPEIQFCFTHDQQKEFNEFFTRIQDKYLELQGIEYMATIRRLGLIAFRIAMIFSAIRIMDTGDFSPKMECTDEDFHSSLAMIVVLVRHASHIFSELPENETKARPKNKKEMFLEGLPARFCRKEYLEVAKTIGISVRSAAAYITGFCQKGLILHEQHDSYLNLTIENTHDSGNKADKK